MERACKTIHLEPRKTAHECRLCLKSLPENERPLWKWDRRIIHAANESRPVGIGNPRPHHECISLGPIIEKCMWNDHMRDVHVCWNDRVEADKITRYADCATCQHYWTDWPIRFDEHNLMPGVGGKRFNSSIFEWRGEYIMAFRDGWAGSEIWIARLTKDFKPTGFYRKLNLWHGEAQYGREDPRLFVFCNKLHIAYVGVQGVSGRVLKTNMLYARLGDDFGTEAIFAPKAPGVPQQQWQKNWSYFEHDSILYASYSIAPHKVLRLDGERCEWAYETPTRANWTWGEMRGGASPILVGDRFWCFFHSKTTHGGFMYYTGLLTFAAEPPFRVLEITPQPILVCHKPTQPSDQYAPVIFTCGAVKHGNEWVLSSGIHDRWMQLDKFNAAELQRSLLEISQPIWWASRSDWEADANIFLSVVGQNEYGLSANMTDWTVLDVGAHIGSFSYAAHRRGATLIHAYEPYPESADLLEINAKRMTGVTAFREAVGKEASRGSFPPLVQVANSGGWSVIPDVNGSAAIIGLGEMIRRMGRKIDLLKIDCEGGEWPAFIGVGDELKAVKRIVGEWHQYEYAGKRWTGTDLIGLLEPHGFRVIVDLPAPGTTWALFRAERN